jgi:hypothetical protein
MYARQNTPSASGDGFPEFRDGIQHLEWSWSLRVCR